VKIEGVVTSGFATASTLVVLSVSSALSIYPVPLVGRASACGDRVGVRGSVMPRKHGSLSAIFRGNCFFTSNFACHSSSPMRAPWFIFSQPDPPKFRPKREN
jgi:hypothetical protein